MWLFHYYDKGVSESSCVFSFRKYFFSKIERNEISLISILSFHLYITLNDNYKCPNNLYFQGLLCTGYILTRKTQWYNAKKKHTHTQLRTQPLLETQKKGQAPLTTENYILIKRCSNTGCLDMSIAHACCCIIRREGGMYSTVFYTSNFVYFLFLTNKRSNRVITYSRLVVSDSSTVLNRNLYLVQYM